MCTVTILKQEDDSFTITMNRDERIFLEEKEPEISEHNAVKIISPKDIKSNGSWVGVNQFGIVACLLNRYDHEFDENKKTRGEVIYRILENNNLDNLKNFDYSSYNPFTLVIFDSKNIIKLDYDGKDLNLENFSINEPFMTTSSSLKYKEIGDFRRDLFSEWLKDQKYSEFEFNGDFEPSKIANFHLKYEDLDEKHTPFVVREKIHTKNICQITLNKDLIDFRYYKFEEIINKNSKINCNPIIAKKTT